MKYEENNNRDLFMLGMGVFNTIYHVFEAAGLEFARSEKDKLLRSAMLSMAEMMHEDDVPSEVEGEIVQAMVQALKVRDAKVALRKNKVVRFPIIRSLN